MDVGSWECHGARGPISGATVARVAQVAEDIGPGLAKAALAGKVDGELVDSSDRANTLAEYYSQGISGVLFATLITLVLVPCLYLVLDDFVRTMRGWWRWR